MSPESVTIRRQLQCTPVAAVTLDKVQLDGSSNDHCRMLRRPAAAGHCWLLGNVLISSPFLAASFQLHQVCLMVERNKSGPSHFQNLGSEIFFLPLLQIAIPIIKLSSHLLLLVHIVCGRVFSRPLASTANPLLVSLLVVPLCCDSCFVPLHCLRARASSSTIPIPLQWRRCRKSRKRLPAPIPQFRLPLHQKARPAVHFRCIGMTCPGPVSATWASSDLQVGRTWHRNDMLSVASVPSLHLSFSLTAHSPSSRLGAIWVSLPIYSLLLVVGCAQFYHARAHSMQTVCTVPFTIPISKVPLQSVYAKNASPIPICLSACTSPL